jgi:hypothetical protein
MAKEKAQAAPSPNGLLRIAGLNKRIMDFGGKRPTVLYKPLPPLRDASGELVRDELGRPLVDTEAELVERPESEQLLLGNVLLLLLKAATWETAEGKPNPRDEWLSRKVGDAVAEAMEGEGIYDAGEPALRILREAAKQNGAKYSGSLILGAVWEAILLPGGEALPEL